MTNIIPLQIVGKDTGILNYPGEVSGPANADHHTICKYRNREDDNYMLLIAFLKQITQNLTSLSMFITGHPTVLSSLLMTEPKRSHISCRDPWSGFTFWSLFSESWRVRPKISTDLPATDSRVPVNGCAEGRPLGIGSGSQMEIFVSSVSPAYQEQESQRSRR